MTREFAQQIVDKANDTLVAIRKDRKATPTQVTMTSGYVEGLLSTVKMMGYAVYLDDKSSLYIIG